MDSNENIRHAIIAVNGPTLLTTLRPFALVVNFGIRPIGNRFAHHATTANQRWNASNINPNSTTNLDRVRGPKNRLVRPLHRRRLGGRTNVDPD